MQALRKYWVLLSLYVCICSIQAEPMHIYFNEMMLQSKTIVSGVYLGFNGTTAFESDKYYFLVQKVFKGNVSNDTLILGRAHGGVNLNPGTTCMAFINKNNEFEWVGNLYNTQKVVDKTILQIEGFYDWNAYLVSPSMISVGQLSDYIKTNSFSGHISGDVQFFWNNEKRMKDSPINLSIKYRYVQGKLDSEVEINGLPLDNFKKTAQVSLPIWDHYLSVLYESNLYRPLEFRGKIMQLHTNDTSWRALFWLDEPEELTYDEFLDFIQNDSYGYPYFQLNLNLANTNS